MSAGEDMLAADLDEAGIPYEREYRFFPPRRWRFDFALGQSYTTSRGEHYHGYGQIAVEVEGGTWSGGRHTRGKGFQNDIEKYNCATLEGWRVFRFTTAMVESGEAITFIKAVWE